MEKTNFEKITTSPEILAFFLAETFGWDNVDRLRIQRWFESTGDDKAVPLGHDTA